MSTLHDAGTRRCADPAGARRLHFTRAMPDPETSRIPRAELLGLLSSAANVDQERITAPMPLARLDELLAPEHTGSAPSPQGTAPELLVDDLRPVLVRFFDPALSRHMTITIVSVAATTLVLGLLLLILF